MRKLLILAAAFALLALPAPAPAGNPSHARAYYGGEASYETSPLWLRLYANKSCSPINWGWRLPPGHGRHWNPLPCFYRPPGAAEGGFGGGAYPGDGGCPHCRPTAPLIYEAPALMPTPSE